MEPEQLGVALRTWRARLRPDDVGIARRGVRRTPGLRRDEVAMLAGVSVEYVVRLEQGRARNPSRQVLEALARALQLSSAEGEHLLRLAGVALPAAGDVSRCLTPSVHRLLQRLDDFPVAVFDATWSMLSCNGAWAALFGELAEPGRPRNLIRALFTGPTASGRVVRSADERQAFAASLVADLRISAARYPADAELRRLIADLRHGSDAFAELWDSHAIGAHVSDHKTIDHPEVGMLTLDCDVLTVTGADLRIVVHSAQPGTPDADALALLRVIGTQQLSS